MGCSVWHVTCSVWGAACGMQRAVCGVRCVGCSVRRAVCGVRCAVCRYSRSTAAAAVVLLWMSDPVLHSLAHLGSSEVGEGHQEHHRGPGPVVLLQHSDRLRRARNTRLV